MCLKMWLNYKQLKPYKEWGYRFQRINKGGAAVMSIRDKIVKLLLQYEDDKSLKPILKELEKGFEKSELNKLYKEGL